MSLFTQMANAKNGSEFLNSALKEMGRNGAAQKHLREAKQALKLAKKLGN